MSGRSVAGFRPYLGSMRLLFSIVLLLATLAARPQAEGYAPGNGVRTNYRSFGSGVPLLIINGGPGISSEGFAEIAQLLSAHNRTIIYDQRGTGRSVLARKDASTITMALMADDIEQLRIHLGYDSWIVMGHSFGGMLASYYTAHYPGRVKGLILSSSGGIDLSLASGFGRSIQEQLDPIEADSLRYWERRIAAGDQSVRARQQRARWIAFAYVYHKEYAPQVAARLEQTDRLVNSLVWQDLRRIGFDCAPGLKNYDGPALIVQGRQDIVDSSAGAKAKLVLSHSRFVLLDNCRHYGWLDQREQFMAEVNGFLKKWE
ncbi:MAG: alpha/beta fold hydrolase [Sphingobacteriales bacterium]|nr:MAG: alpha/beta fold hydrolase [Sphingobacteriales bacterium]